MSGKGHQRRPSAVPPATVDANYERTFHAVQFNGAFPPGRITSAYIDHPDGTRTDLTPSGRADAEG